MPQPDIGFNLQITKVTDRGGGAETVTINTALPPSATADDMFQKIQLIGSALQRRVDVQYNKEIDRQEQERAKVERLRNGTGTPEPSLAPPIDLTNGHARES